MATYLQVKAVRTGSAKHKRMVNAWRANEAAEIEQPAALVAYFGDEMPDNDGLVVCLQDGKDGVTKYNGEDGEGFEVHLIKLPPNTTRLRFMRS